MRFGARRQRFHNQFALVLVLSLAQESCHWHRVAYGGDRSRSRGMTLVRAVGVTLDYWVSGEPRTSYRLLPLDAEGTPAVHMAQFLEPGTSASLPLETILADTGIQDFVAASIRARGFDKTGLTALGRPLRVVIRRLNNGRVRMIYEAASVVGGESLKVTQTWDPATDEIKAEARPEATVSYADFVGFSKTLGAFYAQIAIEKQQ